MNIIVCIKQVPDTTEIHMSPETHTLVRSGVPAIINPFDKNALEAAVQLKEQFGGIVTALTMGPAQAADALRECCALGADRMVLASDRRFGGADTYATSYVLSQAALSLGKFDLIICGRQAIDGDTAQVGPMIAEHLGIPQLTCVSGIEIRGGGVRVRQERENAYAMLEVEMPAVITVTKSINEPRLHNIMRRLMANKKEPELITADDLPGLDFGKIGINGSPTKVRRTFTQQREKRTVYINGVSASETAARLLGELKSARVPMWEE